MLEKSFPGAAGCFSLFDINHISNFSVWLMEILINNLWIREFGYQKNWNKETFCVYKIEDTVYGFANVISANESVFKKWILILFWDPMTTKVWPSIHWNLYVWLKMSWSTNKWSFLDYIFRKPDKTSVWKQKRQLWIVRTFV